MLRKSFKFYGDQIGKTKCQRLGMYAVNNVLRLINSPYLAALIALQFLLSAYCVRGFKELQNLYRVGTD